MPRQCVSRVRAGSSKIYAAGIRVSEKSQKEFAHAVITDEPAFLGLDPRVSNLVFHQLIWFIL